MMNALSGPFCDDAKQAAGTVQDRNEADESRVLLRLSLVCPWAVGGELLVTGCRSKTPAMYAAGVVAVQDCPRQHSQPTGDSSGDGKGGMVSPARCRFFNA